MILRILLLTLLMVVGCHAVCTPCPSNADAILTDDAPQYDLFPDFTNQTQTDVCSCSFQVTSTIDASFLTAVLGFNQALDQQTFSVFVSDANGNSLLLTQDSDSDSTIFFASNNLTVNVNTSNISGPNFLFQIVFLPSFFPDTSFTFQQQLTPDRPSAVIPINLDSQEGFTGFSFVAPPNMSVTVFSPIVPLNSSTDLGLFFFDGAMLASNYLGMIAQWNGTLSTTDASEMGMLKSTSNVLSMSLVQSFQLQLKLPSIVYGVITEVAQQYANLRVVYYPATALQPQSISIGAPASASVAVSIVSDDQSFSQFPVSTVLRRITASNAKAPISFYSTGVMQPGAMVRDQLFNATFDTFSSWAPSVIPRSSSASILTAIVEAGASYTIVLDQNLENTTTVAMGQRGYMASFGYPFPLGSGSENFASVKTVNENVAHFDIEIVSLDIGIDAHVNLTFFYNATLSTTIPLNPFSPPYSTVHGNGYAMELSVVAGFDQGTGGFLFRYQCTDPSTHADASTTTMMTMPPMTMPTGSMPPMTVATTPSHACTPCPMNSDAILNAANPQFNLFPDFTNQGSMDVCSCSFQVTSMFDASFLTVSLGFNNGVGQVWSVSVSDGNGNSVMFTQDSQITQADVPTAFASNNLTVTMSTRNISMASIFQLVFMPQTFPPLNFEDRQPLTLDRPSAIIPINFDIQEGFTAFAFVAPPGMSVTVYSPVVGLNNSTDLGMFFFDGDMLASNYIGTIAQWNTTLSQTDMTEMGMLRSKSNVLSMARALNSQAQLPMVVYGVITEVAQQYANLRVIFYPSTSLASQTVSIGAPANSSVAVSIVSDFNAFSQTQSPTVLRQITANNARAPISFYSSGIMQLGAMTQDQLFNASFGTFSSWKPAVIPNSASVMTTIVGAGATYTLVLDRNLANTSTVAVGQRGFMSSSTYPFPLTQEAANFVTVMTSDGNLAHFDVEIVTLAVGIDASVNLTFFYNATTSTVITLNSYSPPYSTVHGNGYAMAVSVVTGFDQGTGGFLFRYECENLTTHMDTTMGPPMSMTSAMSMMTTVTSNATATTATLPRNSPTTTGVGKISMFVTFLITFKSLL